MDVTGKDAYADDADDYAGALADLEMLLRRAEMNLALIVAEHEMDLSSDSSSVKGSNNTIYVLELDTESSAAGGRVAGFGSRRFKMVHCFKLEDGMCIKMGSVELDDEDIDVEYVTRLPIRLGDGSEVMASCSIDPYTVRLLNSRFVW